MIDWIEGLNLNQNHSSGCELKDEIDFVRMIVLILREINMFHQSDFFHCDIRPENIMAFQHLGYRFFMLIDYGSCFKKGEEDRRVVTFSQGYTPNDKIWTPESDIYSLGYFFFRLNFFFLLLY